jgi:hypothetical protein
LVVRVKSEIYFTVSPIKGLHAAGMPTWSLRDYGSGYLHLPEVL